MYKRILSLVLALVMVLSLSAAMAEATKVSILTNINVDTEGTDVNDNDYIHYIEEKTGIDIEFINWLGQSSIPFCIVFTKADKLTTSKVQSNVAAYKKKLEETWEEMPPMFVSSSEKRQGREELLDYIDNINKQLKEGDN